MMTEWKEYSGSDEQIEEMCGADNGWIVMFYDSTQSEIHNGYPGKNVNMHAIKCYLLCNPPPALRHDLSASKDRAASLDEI